MVTRIIFDADDTLWHCKRYYEQARTVYRQVLTEAGIPGDAPAIERLKEIDSERAEEHGYAKERFYQSMIIAYERLCEYYDVEESETVKDRLEEVGMSVFREPDLFDHTVDTLERLRQTEARMMVLTGGDEEVQRPKFDVLGSYQDAFEIIRTVNHKNESDWREAARLLGGPDHTWAIGNSLRSDVHPALRAGLRAIHLPQGKWYYERTDVERDDYHEAEDLNEALAVLDRETDLSIPPGES